MTKTQEMLGRIGSDMGKARGVSGEDMLIAGLVAAPFTTAFAIWLSQLTWWPNAMIILIWLAVQILGTFWVAGHVREDADDTAAGAGGEAA
ncbi:MAG TPA: hypothetical protein PKA33_04085 [Amaricoccus sp.]|uniref:hypothetical protein n=1 Tax=Amaricoccus sp. TaxID=1872485 RepID=UPI002CB543A5|nr:hypothetical protein [Amaricoccus sp.]HMQ91917.1 hypothetical protein [Amaricoccus sp.]HMR51558.1 hypothetical protein [Amaricoccus sp.]HMR59024.1 hypothetical protein [Amaricoccus sp.]HMT98534.1 hypothetical protein [Amaricoccus sp.]